MVGMRDEEAEANRRYQREMQVLLDSIANQAKTFHRDCPDVPPYLSDVASIDSVPTGSPGELVPSRHGDRGHLTSSTRLLQPSIQPPTFFVTNLTINTNNNAPVTNLDNSSTVTSHSNTLQANHTSSSISQVGDSAATTSTTTGAPGRLMLLLAKVGTAILGLASGILTKMFRDTIRGPMHYLMMLMLRLAILVLIVIVPLYVALGRLFDLFQDQLSLGVGFAWGQISPLGRSFASLWAWAAWASGLSSGSQYTTAGTVPATQTDTVTPTKYTTSFKRIITNPVQLSLFSQQNQQAMEELTEGPSACSSILVGVVREERGSRDQAGTEAGGEDVTPDKLVRELVGSVNITALTDGDVELFRHMSHAIIQQLDVVNLLTGRVRAHPISLDGYPGTVKRFLLLPFYEPFAAARDRLYEGIAHLDQIAQSRLESTAISERVRGAEQSTTAHAAAQRRVTGKYATKLEKRRSELMRKLMGLTKTRQRRPAGMAASPDEAESIDEVIAQMAAARGVAMVAASAGAILASQLDAVRIASHTMSSQMEKEYDLLSMSSQRLGRMVGEIDVLVTRNIHPNEIKFALEHADATLITVLESIYSVALLYFDNWPVSEEGGVA
ncbi:hypothetical protein B0T18DRAFT_388844 [Schizothecium vesticola]|uniref:Uncharacterized protein n=1 Tax=Schizothecium vesticola TaxID=314040 RepID=A0AA40F130_9PEZI|nr:hypothetical protein B0T18DRAFT_388844 [Schizothecium vesticola]